MKIQIQTEVLNAPSPPRGRWTERRLRTEGVFEEFRFSIRLDPGLLRDPDHHALLQIENPGLLVFFIPFRSQKHAF